MEWKTTTPTTELYQQRNDALTGLLALERLVSGGRRGGTPADSVPEKRNRKLTFSKRVANLGAQTHGGSYSKYLILLYICNQHLAAQPNRDSSFTFFYLQMQAPIPSPNAKTKLVKKNLKTVKQTLRTMCCETEETEESSKRSHWLSGWRTSQV